MMTKKKKPFSNSISQENFVLQKKKETKKKTKQKTLNLQIRPDSTVNCLVALPLSLSGDLGLEYCPFYLLDNLGAGSLGHYHENAKC